MTTMRRATRRAAAAAVDVLCALLGRRAVVRAARFVLYRARLDVPNDLRHNGEALLQHALLRYVPTEPVVFDIGANLGEWTASLLREARRAGVRKPLVHAFEPSKYSCDRLATRLQGHGVVVSHLALSDEVGQATLHIRHPGAGVNSLHPSWAPTATEGTESVRLTTVDRYCEEHGLDEVHLIKIDTEGHDLAVLRGARGMLTGHRVTAVQFEYNHRWVLARAYLRDAFAELQPLGYRLGKLTPRGVEFYEEWDPELETYVEGNYVACLPEVAARLPSIAWWKTN